MIISSVKALCYIERMTPSKNSRPRHFPYQHPTFGRGKNVKDESAWKKTIYYVWWSYLKRNEDYLKTCESNGKGSLSKLYEDFGDVRTDDFKAWWTEEARGARLFSNPPAEETVRLLSKNEEAPTEGDHLLVSVPLNLPKKFILPFNKHLYVNYLKTGKPLDTASKKLM